MIKNESAFTKTFPLVMIFTSFMFLVLWIVFKELMWGASFALGSFTMLWSMSLLYKSSEKILKSDVETAQKITVKSYFIRFTLYILILTISGFTENLELLAVAAGLLTFKFMLYVSLYLERKGESK